MNCFKMLLMLIPVLLIRCSAPEDQPAPEPSASTEAGQKKVVADQNQADQDATATNCKGGVS